MDIIGVDLKLSQSCDRCAQNYPLELDACVHCLTLSDDEANRLRQNKHAEHRRLTPLACLFLLIAILLSGVLFFYNVFP